MPDTYRPVTTPGVWIPTTPPLFAEYARAKPWVMKSADQVRPGAAARSQERALCPRLQRDQGAGRRQEHQAHGRADRGGQVLDPAELRPGVAGGGRVSCRPRRSCRWPTTPGCLRCSTWAWPTPSSPTGTPSSPTISGGPSRRSATATRMATTPPSAMPAGRRSMPRPCIPSIRRRQRIVAGVSMGVFEAVFGPDPSTAGGRQRPAGPQAAAPIRQRPAGGRRGRAVRVWGGIHFRNSLDVGYGMGRKIADFLVENSLKPTN